MTPPAAHAMQLAIDASRAALALGDEPYGASLVGADGQVLMVAQNNQNTSGDCTGHAEMVLVRRAQAELGAQALRGATVYASGEPCAMCAGALFWAGVGQVVFAAAQPDMAAAVGGALLPARCADVLAAAEPPVPVIGGVLATEALAVITQARRHRDAPPSHAEGCP